MTNNQQSQRTTQAQKNKTVLIVGVIRVIDQLGSLIDENRFGLFKTDPVLLDVCRSFALIPLKAQIAHG